MDPAVDRDSACGIALGIESAFDSVEGIQQELLPEKVVTIQSAAP